MWSGAGGGPGIFRSENARPNGWVYVDIADRDIGSFVAEAQQAVAQQVDLPSGYPLAWSGQFEYMQRAKERLFFVVPVTLAIILLLPYLNFRAPMPVLIIMLTLPLALVGGLWLLYLLDYHLSVAVGVGFIAFAGVAVEVGVLLIVYLNQAFERTQREGPEKGRPPHRD